MKWCRRADWPWLFYAVFLLLFFLPDTIVQVAASRRTPHHAKLRKANSTAKSENDDPCQVHSSCKCEYRMILACFVSTLTFAVLFPPCPNHCIRPSLYFGTLPHPIDQPERRHNTDAAASDGCSASMETQSDLQLE